MTTLPRGLRNNNPLNIRRSASKWKGLREVQIDKSFCQFKTISYGIRAGLVIIRNYMSGRAPSCLGKPATTIHSIISRWAPSTENATYKYVAYVAEQCNKNRFEPISFSDRETVCKMVYAMCFIECGQHVSMELIQSVYDAI